MSGGGVYADGHRREREDGLSSSAVGEEVFGGWVRFVDNVAVAAVVGEDILVAVVGEGSLVAAGAEDIVVRCVECSNAGLGGAGCCMLAATGRNAAAVAEDSSLLCPAAVVVEAAGMDGREQRLADEETSMGVAGLGCLEGEEESLESLGRILVLPSCSCCFRMWGSKESFPLGSKS